MVVWTPSGGTNGAVLLAVQYSILWLSQQMLQCCSQPDCAPFASVGKILWGIVLNVCSELLLTTISMQSIGGASKLGATAYVYLT